jgi:hypothetical protein
MRGGGRRKGVEVGRKYMQEGGGGRGDGKGSLQV